MPAQHARHSAHRQLDRPRRRRRLGLVAPNVRRPPVANSDTFFSLSSIYSKYQHLYHSHSFVFVSPVHTSNAVEATLSNATRQTSLSTKSNVAPTLLQFLATMLPVFGNKVEFCFDTVERCFDIVAGVDGALRCFHALKRDEVEGATRLFFAVLCDLWCGLSIS